MPRRARAWLWLWPARRCTWPCRAGLEGWRWRTSGRRHPASACEPRGAGSRSGLSRASRHRCDTAETSEGLVVARAQGFVGFGEEGREDDPPTPEAMRGSRWGMDTRRRCGLESQELRPRSRTSDPLRRRPWRVLGHQAHLVDEDLDVRDDRFGRAGGDMTGWLAQQIPELVGVDGSHSMAPEEVLDGCQTQTKSSGGCAGDGPQFDDPQLGQVALDVEQLREVAPELLAETVDESGPLRGQGAGDAGPLAEFDDLPGLARRVCGRTGDRCAGHRPG